MTGWRETFAAQGPALAAAAVISLIMSGVMSGVMIALSFGLGPAFPALWMRGWALGFLVSLPTARLIVPPIIRWSRRLR